MTYKPAIAGAPDPMDKSQWRRSATPSIAVDEPFDPAPLMDRVRARLSGGRFRFAVFGDTHLYYRTVRDGVTHVVSGGAGGNVSTLQHPVPVLPQDSYAGRDPHTDKYVLHTPSRDESWDAQQYFFTLIDVDGSSVTGRTVSTTGQTWEAINIRPNPRVQ